MSDKQGNKAYRFRVYPSADQETLIAQTFGCVRVVHNECLAPLKSPVTVLDHDFELEELGKAVPYGVYDIGANEGWVSIGISKDTAEFAVNTMTLWWWWQQMGSKRHPNARRLMVTADSGGSDSKVSKLWKRELQKFANETGLEIEVHHYPAGT